MSRVIGYSYGADAHCVACTKRAQETGILRFYPWHPHAQVGKDHNGLWLDACDSEGNRIHAMFSTDEGASDEHCGDCGFKLLEDSP